MSDFIDELPIPSGWFCLAPSSEIVARSIWSGTIGGEEVVATRLDSGVAVYQAHCPHLGAHLGIGGTSTADSIVCPFHGFCFDSDGTCVATGYGDAPPAGLTATTYPTTEQEGFVFVWLGAAGPSWHLPELTGEGWSRVDRRSFRLRDHPQETTENSVDVGHFAIVHGYSDVNVTEPAATDGPLLTISYQAQRKALSGFITTDFSYAIQAWGLGYSLVHVDIPSEGLRARLLVLSTPIDATHVELTLALRLRSFRLLRPRRALLRWIPYGERLVASAILAGFAGDAHRDFEIWENKRHVAQPRLAQGDGPIGVYRKWVRQFY